MSLPTLPPSTSWPTSITFPQMVEEWLKWGALRWEPKWYARCEWTTSKLVRWIGDRTLTPQVIGEWEDHLLAIGSPDIKSIPIASMVYRHAIRNGWAARNPFSEYRSKPVARERRRVRKIINHQYWERIAQIAAKARCGWYPLWVGCYETGMDRLDVTTLKWEHIDRQTWTIKRVRHKLEKRDFGGEFSTAVDPSGRFYKSILWAAELLKRKGANADDIDREYVFPKLFKVWSGTVAGAQTRMNLLHFFKEHHLEPFTFHDLRFARITAMVNAGVPYHVVRQVSGHATDAMLLRYVGNHIELTRASVLHSNRFSALCPTQAKLPSASEVTASPTSSDSTSEPARTSSRKRRSSSAMINPGKVSAFEAWQKRREQRMQEAIAAVPIVPETGKLSSQEQFGDDHAELPSSSSSASDSSPSEDWQD